jgi:DNA-binding Lrp family transcriptional regulator
LEFGISSSDARLLTLLQSGLPLTAEPFAPLAQTLGLNIAQLLHRLAELKAAGLLRRLGAIFDSRALGYVTTLVAARVPDPRIDAVAAAVSDLAGVTHNYRRDHDYNLWFTLISESLIRQQETLAALSQRTGVQFFPLPAEKLYKLRVQFDLEASDVAQPPSAVPNEQDKPAANTVQPRAAVPHKTLPTPSPAASLDEGQKALIRLLQDDLPLVERPFDLLARQLGRPVEHVLAQLADWQKTGTLRRLGAILHHRALGFTANGMAVFDVSAPRLDAAGAILAARPDISHCYRRPPLPDFPYNLYAMIHGRSKPQVLAALEEILAALGPCPHAVLFSTRQYKKSSMRYFA